MRISERTRWQIRVEHPVTGALIDSHTVGTALAARRHEAEAKRALARVGLDLMVRTVVDRRPEIGT